VFIRPRFGSGAKQCFIARNEQELAFFREYAPDPIIQEYIKGDEYTVDILADMQSHPIMVVPRRRIEARDGEIVKGVTVADAYLIQHCADITRHLHLIGLNCIQCIKRDESYFFTEINPRFGGGITMSIKAGADFPLHLREIVETGTSTPDGRWEAGKTFARAYRDFA